MSRLSMLLIGFIAVISLSLVGQDDPPPTPQPSDESIDFIFTIQSIISDYYVDSIDIKTLLHGAIQGMMNTLDPHSSYMTTQSYNQLIQTYEGELFGYGLQVTMKNKGVYVVNPVPGSSAQQQGILSGDQILQIDQLIIKYQPFEIINQYIQIARQEQRPLDIIIQRGDESLSLQLIAQIPQLNSVTSYWLNNHIGLIILSHFSERTALEVQQALGELAQKSAQEIILDLRDNPGGSFDAAIDVADLFIEQGTIVRTQGRFWMTNSHHIATKGDILPKIPLVVLINQESASSAEILAGALKAQERATLLGERSYGKGTVQSLIPLADGFGAIKITTARYAMPGGELIDNKGIAPDIFVDCQGEQFIADLSKNWRHDAQIFAAYNLLQQKR